MNVRRAALSLCLIGLAPTACALAGYDFGDYQPATHNAGSASDQETTGGAATAGRPDDGHGNELPLGGSSTGASGEASTSAGAPAEHPIGPEPTTFGAGGGPSIEGTPQGEGGNEAGVGGAQGDGCVPASCGDLAAECGAIDDGCGKELDCGGCFWWFLECRENSCQFTE